jgi:hypothetical protein
MPFWKCRALALGYTQRVINDAALNTKTPVRDEDKPPPLVADVNGGQSSSRPDDETAPCPRTQIDPAVLDAIERKVDEIAARMDRFEVAQHAAAVLEALEEQIEREHPPTADDGAGLTMQ